MTYILNEQSVAASAPAELYTITIGATVYRYTSHEVAVTYDSNSYTPVPGLKRNDIEVATQDDPPELIVELPTSNAFVMAYAFSPPPKSIHVSLRRVQRVSGLSLQLWSGKVGGITVKGKVAKLRIPCLLDDGLHTAIPNRQFKAQCNHVLFDARCDLAEGDFDVTGITVSSISTDGKTIVVSGVGGNPDKWFKDGRIKRSTDSEWRMITSQVGTTLMIDAPFRTLAAGNSVVIYPGCDKAIKTCRDKFNNVLNFGGHPNIPRLNPYNVSLAQNPLF